MEINPDREERMAAVPIRSFEEKTLSRARTLRKKYADIKIQLDGGVRPE